MYSFDCLYMTASGLLMLAVLTWEGPQRGPRRGRLGSMRRNLVSIFANTTLLSTHLNNRVLLMSNIGTKIITPCSARVDRISIAGLWCSHLVSHPGRDTMHLKVKQSWEAEWTSEGKYFIIGYAELYAWLGIPKKRKNVLHVI